MHCLWTFTECVDDQKRGLIVLYRKYPSARMKYAMTNVSKGGHRGTVRVLLSEGKRSQMALTAGDYLQ